MMCPMCDKEMAREDVVTEKDGQDIEIEAFKCFFCGEEIVPNDVSVKYRVM